MLLDISEKRDIFTTVGGGYPAQLSPPLWIAAFILAGALPLPADVDNFRVRRARFAPATGRVDVSGKVFSYACMTKPLKIVSWNINSVRLRAPNVAAFTEAEAPDVICLQETKCRDGEFPTKAFEEMGLPHLAIHGQGGGHYGVAIASRFPIEAVEAPKLCREGHARIVCAKVTGVEIHNIYLPAGGDVPDPDENPKFAHKLDFLRCMARDYKKRKADKTPLILVGDLNVAPHENDVWSHKQLLKIVSHTPVETDAMAKIVKQGGFSDIARESVDDDQKLYSWWSYRAKDWAKSNRGRRLDHIWANETARKGVDPATFKVHLAYRGGWKPSDHAPISASIKA